ncbi:hypothetical protein [Achromobacter marplatensis]|uniref:hypothetical protein n=1 Tax=Achromobacter marplatensis TaxID=470868 RepID=UPI0028F0B5A6|nr:hypothetical protein [Achromobacter marplatensis]
MSGFIYIANTPDQESLDTTLEAMNKATREWELKAARGECGWICAWCCSGFPTGMPDECDHGIQECTDLLKRDKAAAQVPQQGEA